MLTDTLMKIDPSKLTIHPSRAGSKKDKGNQVTVFFNPHRQCFEVVDGVQMFRQAKKASSLVVKVASLHEAKQLIAPLPRPNLWSEAEIEELRRMVGLVPIPQIAARFGKKEGAIRGKIRRLGLKTRRSRKEFLSMCQVSRELGMSVASILIIAKVGKFPPPIEFDKRDYLIRRVTFYRWVVNPMNWPYFAPSIRMPRRIKNKWLRRLVIRQKQRWGDEWLTITEAAESKKVHACTLRKYIHELEPILYSHYYVRKSKVAAWKSFKREWASERADNFIIAEALKGTPMPVIALKMKRTTPQVYARYRDHLAQKVARMRSDS